MSLHTLQPVSQQRLWGGRNLETLFSRPLPPDLPIGESWELCDRPEAQTRLVEKDCTLHELWSGPGKKDFFGTRSPDHERFPILIKLLDAQDRLSLQVHPPADLAPRFNGEPKTECWYFLETAPGALIYAGLQHGVTRESFAQALKDGKLADCFFHLKPRPGDLMFLPSGRAHAIGAGNIILEVQQNSDTTFRVYDWDRTDPNTGKGRDLHIDESLACINYSDHEPSFALPQGESLLRCRYFNLNRIAFYDKEDRELHTGTDSFQFLFTAQGRFQINDKEYPRGTSLLVNAGSDPIQTACLDDYGEILTVTWPE